MAQSELPAPEEFVMSREAGVNARPLPPPSRRRDKPQLSCNLCRRRKTRCNRQQPCSNCSARGQPCVYAENQAPGPLTQESNKDTTLHDRLVHLERLVTTLRSTSQSNQNSDPEPNVLGTPESPDARIDDRSETGSLRVGASQQCYVGGDHWAAILDNIADLKAHFDREEEAKLVEHHDPVIALEVDDGGLGLDIAPKPHTMLLYGCRPARSRAEILSGLPPKSAVDRYISRYFNQFDLVASSSAHGPTFLREYEAFWTDPSGPTIMWIGLLYSMICLAVIASDVTQSTCGVDVEQQRLQLDLYREKVVQCLVMGRYTQGGPHALETFLNYVYIEFRIHPDADKDVWYLLGIEVNLAKRMGYHRDPKYFPHITPREGEMRRRVWATVLLSDCLISGQMGMPRMITSSQFDTQEPRNLNDTDIDGDIAELPHARPETEHTTSLGIIARRRILIALGAVSDITSSLQSCSYAEVMKVDTILNEAGRSIPPPLQMKSMATSVTDSPQTIMSRLFLSHIFYKGQIMLHRKFLFMDSPSSENDFFEYSRKACLHATLETLKIQQVLDEETCPGGQLQMLHWRVGSIMNHHFLTATMILCSMVHRKKMLGREEEIMTALRTSRLIWMRKGSESREARKAAQAVSIVLARAGGPRFDMGFTPENNGKLRTEQKPVEQTATFNTNHSMLDNRQSLGVNLNAYQETGDFSISELNMIYGHAGQNIPLNLNDISEFSDWMFLSNMDVEQ